MNSFKRILKVLQILLFITLVAAIIVVISLFFSGSSNTFISPTGLGITQEDRVRSGVLVLINSAFLFPLFYGITSLIKTIPFFENTNYFDLEVTKKFEKTSKAFIISGFSGIALQIIQPLIEKSKVILGFDIKTFLFLFILAIGFFFGFLASVFDKARITKTENDLTI